MVLGDHRDRGSASSSGSWRRAAEKTKWLADAFIQLIKTVTGPVIFVTVVIGIASLGNLARAGGLALRALAYFFAMTVIALALGLFAANIFTPGAGFDAEPSESARESAKESIDEAGGTEPGPRRLHQRRPAPDELPAAVRGQQDPAVLVLAILVAAAISMLADRYRKPILSVFEVASKVIFGVIRLIMWAAPIGAFGGMAYTVSVFGAGSLRTSAS